MTFLERIRRRLPDFPPYYEAPTGDHVRLDQNANLLGPHPEAGKGADLRRVNLYPTRDNTPILQALAKAYGLDPRHYFVANGSDEAIDWCLRVLLEPGQRLVTPWPTYGFYANLARLNRITHVRVPVNDDFQVRAESLLAENPDLVLIANPNNPTGTLFDPALVGRLLKEFSGPIVVDEAYAEFAHGTVLPLVERYPNLVVTRTLSKAYGLAGLRVGFAAAHPDVAELVRRAKHPFSVNSFSEQVAVRALADPRPVRAAVEQIVKERERLATALQGLGFRVVPSHANFLLTVPPIPAEDLYESLRRQRILTRIFRQEPSLRDFLRFTVGKPEENQLLLATLRRLLDESGGDE